jgi:hypothetical protein
MLSGKQEKIVIKFKAGLCKMHNGNLAEPYESATIETDSTPAAIDKAKRGARTVEDATTHGCKSSLKERVWPASSRGNSNAHRP